MPLTEYRDYVFAPKVNMLIDYGVFVGTQDYLFCFPSRTEEHEWRKIITTTHSFAGKPMDEAVHHVILSSSNKSELENQLVLMAEDIPDTTWFKIDDLGCFKVEAHFLGSGIHTNEKDRKVGFKPFIQNLGKSRKKQIKAFYEGHPKHQ